MIRAKISDMLKVLSIRLKKIKYVLVFDISETMSNQISAVYLREHVEKTIAECKALIYDGRVVCIASFPAEGGIDIATNDLEMLLKKFRLHCGISRCFEQLAALRVPLRPGAQCHENRSADDNGSIGIPLRRGRDAACCRQLYGNRDGRKALFIRGFLLWSISTSEHHTDFVITLTAYLRNFGNITNMSKGSEHAS